jgi:hypothetical protein
MQCQRVPTSEPDIVQLLEQCAGHDSSFVNIRRYGEYLAPYTNDLLHDGGFNPSLGTARAALNSAQTILDFVLLRMKKNGGEN